MTARRGQTGNAWDSPGGGISPLIANVYMNRSLKVLRLRGLDRRDGARLVNYADDCAPRRRREEAVRSQRGRVDAALLHKG
jgi:hypothetical protein